MNLALTRISTSKCNRGMRSESRRRGSQIATQSTVLIVALVASLSVIWPIMSTAQSQVSEYQLKAAFLFHFAQFVEWPAGALGPGDNPFLICIAGEDPFHGDLEEAVRGKFIAAKVVRIRHIKQIQESAGCHVVFIGKDESGHLSQLIATLRNMPVLTVGESENFLQSGGIIRFCMEDRKVRFEVNKEAAEAANLKISSRLLLLAKTVVKREGGT